MEVISVTKGPVTYIARNVSFAQRGRAKGDLWCRIDEREKLLRQGFDVKAVNGSFNVGIIHDGKAVFHTKTRAQRLAAIA